MQTTLQRKVIPIVFSWLALSAMTLFVTSAGLAAEPASATYSNQDTFEATALVTQMKNEAVKVQSDADTLRAYYWNNLSWETNGFLLSRMAHRVKHIDQMLGALQTTNWTSGPEQERAVTRVAPRVIDLTDQVNDAISYFRDNQQALSLPAWGDKAKGIYESARELNQELGSMQESANLSASAASFPLTRQ